MLIESLDKEFTSCLQSVRTIMFLNNWFPTQGDLESYTHIEVMSRQHWNPNKIEFPQQKKSVQEEVEGRNVSKVTIWLYRETPGDTDLPLHGDTRGDFRSNRKEVVFHACMENFHRRLVAGIAVTAARASSIFTINRDNNREILTEVIIKESKYRG